MSKPAARRMTAAKIKKTLEAALRKHVAEQWGLPMDQYTAAVTVEDFVYENVRGTTDLSVVFTHRTTGATVTCEDIIADSLTGEIIQCSRYVMDWDI